MRYHYEKPDFYKPTYGQIYVCNHPVYNRCTLYKIGEVGLAVIQQRYDSKNKKTWWTEIDEWLTGEIYLHPSFFEYFKSRADVPENDIYPTVTIRQAMWALKMKPLKRERWETCFDRKDV